MISSQGAFAQKNPTKAIRALKPTSQATAHAAGVARSSVTVSAKVAAQSALSVGHAVSSTAHTAVRPSVATNIAAGVERQAYAKLREPAFRRTPEEVLTELETFIAQNNRYPSRTATDPAERSLRNAADRAIRNAKNPQEQTIVRLTALKKQWVKEISEARTPEEVLTELETFIAQNNRYPSKTATDPAERSLRNAADRAINDATNSQDPTIVRLTALKQQWVRLNSSADRAAKLAEERLTPGMVTDEYVEQLTRFYDKLDPLGLGWVE